MSTLCPAIIIEIRVAKQKIEDIIVAVELALLNKTSSHLRVNSLKNKCHKAYCSLLYEQQEAPAVWLVLSISTAKCHGKSKEKSLERLTKYY